MAARKDYGQKNRRRSAATPARSAPVKNNTRKVASTQRRTRRPWGLALAAALGLAALVLLLNQLLNVTPPLPPASSAQPTPAQSASSTTALKPPAKTVSPPAVHQQPAKASTPAPQNTTQSTAEQPPRYEFYELLKKSEVQSPKVEAYKSTPKTAKMAQRYLLQAGSFRSQADAEKMRAQLLLSGLPNVQTSRSDGANGTWYRVRLGPFDNRTQMRKAHNKLAKLHISPIAIKVD